MKAQGCFLRFIFLGDEVRFKVINGIDSAGSFDYKRNLLYFSIFGTGDRTMKKNTPLGKVIFWAGFLFFILGMSFNESLGWIQDAPGFFSSFSIPAVIIGIVLIVISNFFVRKD